MKTRLADWRMRPVSERILFLLTISAIVAVLVCWLIIPRSQPTGVSVRATLDTLDSGTLQLTWGDGVDQAVALEPLPHLAPNVRPAWHRLEITPLGPSHGLGQEVWLLGATDDKGVEIPALAFAGGAAWDSTSSSRIYRSGERSTLRWEGRVAGLNLMFLSHGWSGRALVRWDGRETEVDLSGERQQSRIIVLGPREWAGSLPPGTAPSNLSLRFGTGMRSGTLGALAFDTEPPVRWSFRSPRNKLKAETGIELKRVSRGIEYSIKHSPAGIILPAPPSAPLHPVRSLTVCWLGSFAVVAVILLCFCGTSPRTEPHQASAWTASCLSRDCALVCCILLLLSLFLVFRSPVSDSGTALRTAQTQLDHGTDTQPPNSLPDIIFAIGKDGNAHYMAEYSYIVLYRELARLGRAIDRFFPPADDWWTAELALIELPHLLMLPLLGAILLLTLKHLGCSRRTSIWCTFVGTFSTIIPYYVAPYTRDGLALPVTAAIFYCLVRARTALSRRWQWTLLAGLLTGLSVLLKMTAGAIALPAGIYIVLVEWFRPDTARFKRLIAHSLLFSLPVLAAVGLLFFRNWQIFGIISPLPDPSPSDALVGRWTATPGYQGVHGLLFSPGKGFFWYCPLACLIFCAWPSLRKSMPFEALFFLLHLLVLLALVATLDVWPGDHSWGPRYLLNAVPWLLITVTWWLSEKNSVSAWVQGNILAAIGILVQIPPLFGSLDNYFRLIAAKAPEHLYYTANWIPSLSPIVIHWKLLLSWLTNSALFGSSPLKVNAHQTVNVNFASNFRLRETFWYEVVMTRWNLHQELGLLVVAATLVFALLLLRPPHRAD